jgi:NTP pyrophosphatase (non-canonical NTP hydrolase)
MTINELMIDSHENAVLKGWWDGGARNFGELLMLMVGELSEAMEEYRTNGLDGEMIYYKDGKPEGIAVEFADVLIRMVDTCAAYNIPIEEALKIKSEFNKTRSYRHGGKIA